MTTNLYTIIKSELNRKNENNISPCLITQMELEKLVSDTNIPIREIKPLIKALYNEGKVKVGHTVNHWHVAIPEIEITKSNK